MLKTYCFTWNDGRKTTVKDVKCLDDTHNTYSVYAADDVLVFSVPIIQIQNVIIDTAKVIIVDDSLIKAEGSE